MHDQTAAHMRMFQTEGHHPMTNRNNAASLDPLELRAWLTVVAVFEALPAAVDRQLKTHSGLNLFEYTVLAILSDEPDQTVSMSDLADLAFGSLSRLSHAVTRLENRGWVDRSVGVGGRRHNVVTLSPEGRGVLEAVAPVHVAHVRELLVDPLDAGDTEVLADLLLKVLSTVNPELHAQFDRLVGGVVQRRQLNGDDA